MGPPPGSSTIPVVDMPVALLSPSASRQRRTQESENTCTCACTTAPARGMSLGKAGAEMAAPEFGERGGSAGAVTVSRRPLLFTSLTEMGMFSVG